MSFSVFPILVRMPFRISANTSESNRDASSSYALPSMPQVLLSFSVFPRFARSIFQHQCISALTNPDQTHLDFPHFRLSAIRILRLLIFRISAKWTVAPASLGGSLSMFRLRCRCKVLSSQGAVADHRNATARDHGSAHGCLRPNRPSGQHPPSVGRTPGWLAGGPSAPKGRDAASANEESNEFPLFRIYPRSVFRVGLDRSNGCSG